LQCAKESVDVVTTMRLSELHWLPGGLQCAKESVDVVT